MGKFGGETELWNVMQANHGQTSKPVSFSKLSINELGTIEI
jgi:hypothetical protein